MYVSCNFGWLSIFLHSEKTELEIAPEDDELTLGETHELRCKGQSDDSTPIVYTWNHNDRRVQLMRGSVEIEEVDGVSILRLITGNMDDQGASMIGEYTCHVSNGYSEDTAKATLSLPPTTTPTTPPTTPPTTKLPIEGKYQIQNILILFWFNFV